MVEVVNLADLACPGDPQRRTFRQINAEMTHDIPIGALVELDNGERLYVKRHARDCDQTPLYSLGLLHEDEPRKWSHGHLGMTVIGLGIGGLIESADSPTETQGE